LDEKTGSGTSGVAEKVNRDGNTQLQYLSLADIYPEDGGLLMNEGSKKDDKVSMSPKRNPPPRAEPSPRTAKSTKSVNFFGISPNNNSNNNNNNHPTASSLPPTSPESKPPANIAIAVKPKLELMVDRIRSMSPQVMRSKPAAAEVLDPPSPIRSKVVEPVQLPLAMKPSRLSLDASQEPVGDTDPRSLITSADYRKNQALRAQLAVELGLVAGSDVFISDSNPMRQRSGLGDSSLKSSFYGKGSPSLTVAAPTPSKIRDSSQVDMTPSSQSSVSSPSQSPFSPHSEQFRQTRMKFESLINQNRSGHGLSSSHSGIHSLQLGTKFQETKQKFEYLIEKNSNHLSPELKRSGRNLDGRSPALTVLENLSPSPARPYDVTAPRGVPATTPIPTDVQQVPQPPILPVLRGTPPPSTLQHQVPPFPLLTEPYKPQPQPQSQSQPQPQPHNHAKVVKEAPSKSKTKGESPSQREKLTPVKREETPRGRKKAQEATSRHETGNARNKTPEARTADSTRGKKKTPDSREGVPRVEKMPSPTTSRPQWRSPSSKDDSKPKKVSPVKEDPSRPQKKSPVVKEDTSAKPKPVLGSETASKRAAFQRSMSISNSSSRSASKSRSQSPSSLNSKSHLYFDPDHLATSSSKGSQPAREEMNSSFGEEVSPYEAYRRLKSSVAEPVEKTKAAKGLESPQKHVARSDAHSSRKEALSPQTTRPGEGRGGGGNGDALSTPLLEIKSLSALQTRARATSGLRIQSMMSRQGPPSSKSQDEQNLELARAAQALIARSSLQSSSLSSRSGHRGSSDPVEGVDKKALALKLMSMNRKLEASSHSNQLPENSKVTDMYEKILMTYFTPPSLDRDESDWR
jgi:hypothetical protein